MTALALSGCMHTSGPVAVAQPQGNLDDMAYGPPYYPAAVADSGGGALAALGASFASAPPQAYAPVPVAYAAAPVPVAYDTAYRLDAGDKLRIVVFGQEGLTNTYAIDAGGSITMPLIGAVPARG
ncbi:polysaccharide biosynthesis/export family protein, partial [Bradyrhizobium sp.]|uniref:polysaccharide biosynthesis/export family protein n=1 Tax=Bradyrhizobium sp. TaxID=376 RepID=UPI0025C0BB83